MAFDPYLHIITCPICGVVYGLQNTHFEGMRDDGGSWSCPNGHWRTFKETLTDRLKAEIKEKNRLLENSRSAESALSRRLESNRRRLSATQGVVTRFKKRIQIGKCPECASEFKNLRRHMLKKHPGYAAAVPDVVEEEEAA